MDSKDYNQIYYELHTIFMTVEAFSDATLVEEVSSVARRYRASYIDDVLDLYYIGEELTPQQRKDLEHFYIITNTQLGFDV